MGIDYEHCNMCDEVVYGDYVRCCDDCGKHICDNCYTEDMIDDESGLIIPDKCPNCNKEKEEEEDKECSKCEKLNDEIWSLKYDLKLNEEEKERCYEQQEEFYEQQEKFCEQQKKFCEQQEKLKKSSYNKLKKKDLILLLEGRDNKKTLLEIQKGVSTIQISFKNEVVSTYQKKIDYFKKRINTFKLQNKDYTKYQNELNRLTNPDCK